MLDRLYQLGYMSQAVELMSDRQLEKLLDSARNNNQQQQITGMLLYADGAFLQVIEGPKTALERVFARIQADSSHQRIKILFDEPITQRQFSQWSMGFRRLQTSQDISDLPGMNNFLESGQGLEEYFSHHAQPSALLRNIFIYFKCVA